MKREVGKGRHEASGAVGVPARDGLLIECDILIRKCLRGRMEHDTAYAVLGRIAAALAAPVAPQGQAVAEVVERVGRFGKPELTVAFIHDGVNLPKGTKLYAGAAPVAAPLGEEVEGLLGRLTKLHDCLTETPGESEDEALIGETVALLRRLHPAASVAASGVAEPASKIQTKPLSVHASVADPPTFEWCCGPCSTWNKADNPKCSECGWDSTNMTVRMRPAP